MHIKDRRYAKPFLKWAGGKTRLLEQLSNYFPEELKKGEIENYYEPFLGSGAVFFYVSQNYPIKRKFLSDINKELILTFKVVKKDVQSLIEKLKELKEQYYVLKDFEQKLFFYNIRKIYNEEKSNIDFKHYSYNWINRAAQMIIINKICYNGLYRLNRKGEFNVPFGRYKKPGLVDEQNLLKVSEILQTAEIFFTDFENIKKHITTNFFIYFDPPYRPISKTSGFTSYNQNDFNDKDQIRLAGLYKMLGRKGNKLMLSNSDPRNENSGDNFFENHYKSFYIKRVKAPRMINCKSDRRGAINELIITNYEPGG